MQAFVTLLRYDAGQIWRSWLVRIWIALLVIPAIFLIAVSASEEELASETLAAYMAAVIAPLSWLAVSVFSAGAVNGEANVVADSILSKSVTRTEYMAAKIAARLGSTLLVYFAVMAPFAYLVERYAVGDTSLVGVAGGVLAVAALFAFLSSLGITLSVLIRNVQFAVIVLLLLVLLSGLLFQFLGLHWLSTTSVINRLPGTFRGETAIWQELRVFAVFSLLAAAAVASSIWLFRRKDL